jgi:hypothetical protein
VRMNAGDPEALREAMSGLDEFLGVGSGESNVVSLHDPAREAAWAELGG